MDGDVLLTTKQAADRLGVDIKTIRRYLQSGKLRGARLAREYRIPESELNALLTRQPGEPLPVRVARVTAIVNQKGGVGKTTTTFNLGAALRKLNRRVLLVDLDPQAALSVSAGIAIAQLKASVYQALLDEHLDVGSIIQELPSGMHVLPATIDLAAAEVELVNQELREYVLKDVVAKLRPLYDHILIDCPPSLGLLTVNALAAADQVIIPMQCEFLSTRGLSLLLRTIKRIQSRLNRDLRLAGILPTMFDGRTLHAAEVLRELQNNFPGQVYDIVIKHTVRVKESPVAGISMLDYDPSGDVAIAYQELATEVDRG